MFRLPLRWPDPNTVIVILMPHLSDLLNSFPKLRPFLAPEDKAELTASLCLQRPGPYMVISCLYSLEVVFVKCRNVSKVAVLLQS